MARMEGLHYLDTDDCCLLDAAPDMLEALKEFINQERTDENGLCFDCGREWDGDQVHCIDDCPGEIARAAIAKATGAA